MIYKFNGKSITISDAEIKNLMDSLELSKQEAIDLWLTDHDYEFCEEQEKLDEKAKTVKISKEAHQKTDKKSRKKPEIKVSDEKQALFESILKNLDRCEGVERENITVLTKNKLISVKINGITFKIDIIQTRKGKKTT